MYHICFFYPQLLPVHQVKEQMNRGKCNCVCLCVSLFVNECSALDQPISVLIFGVRGHIHTRLMKSHSLHIIAIMGRYKPISLFLWAQTHTHACTGLSLHAVKLFQLYYPSDVLCCVFQCLGWRGQIVCVWVQMQSKIVGSEGEMSAGKAQK